ncbi:MAG: hypothetical protein KatS3mg119_1153 [Rhodothalassiaceae bacterium]|nr:MAG: hypothetical protein KatS3mg119_1153 [Rhodothalassiaceae bacterium]
MHLLVIEDRPGESRSAWIVGGRPAALVFRRDHWPAAGDVHLARVTAHAPDSSGAFLLLDEATGLAGFLKRRGRASPPEVGRIMPVTVAAHDPAAGDKQARVEPGVRLAGRYLTLAAPGRGLALSDSLKAAAEMHPRLEAALGPLAARAAVRVNSATAHVPVEAVAGEAGRLAARLGELEAAVAAGGPARRLHRPPFLEVALAAGPAGRFRLLGDAPFGLRGPGEEAAASFPDLAGVEDAEDAFAATGVADWLEEVAAGRLALAGGGHLRLALAPSGIVVDVDAGARPARGDRRELLRRLGTETAATLARAAAALRLQGLVVVDLPVPRDAAFRRALEGAFRDAFAAAGLGRDVAGPNRHGIVSIALARAGTPVPAFLDMPGLPERLRREARLFAALRPLARRRALPPGATTVPLRLERDLVPLLNDLGLQPAWEAKLGLALAIEAADTDVNAG